MAGRWFCGLILLVMMLLMMIICCDPEKFIFIFWNNLVQHMHILNNLWYTES